MVAHLVQLEAAVVVHVQVFLLRYCKHGVVMEEADITDELLDGELTLELLLLPVEHRQVALLPGQQQLVAVVCVSVNIRPELKLQVKDVTSGLLFWQRSCNFFLSDLQSSLSLMLDLQEARVFYAHDFLLFSKA